MRKFIVGRPRLALHVLLALFLTYGCATPRPPNIWLKKNVITRLKVQPEIKAVHYPPPAFRVWTSSPPRTTPGGQGGFSKEGLEDLLEIYCIIFMIACLPLMMAGGLVVDAGERSAGSDMKKKFSIEDPIVAVKAGFAQGLGKALGLTNIRPVQKVLTDDVLESEETLGKGAVFDFRTTDWSFDRRLKTINYSAEASLIHPGDPKVHWRGRCPEKRWGPVVRTHFLERVEGTRLSVSMPTPKKDEAVAARVALFKTKLAELARQCAEKLVDKFLDSKTLVLTADSEVYSVAFSPDGILVASGGKYNTIRMWEVSTGREVRVLKGHAEAVRSVAFSPDGRFLASGSWDDTIRLWEVSTGREIRVLKGHSHTVLSVAFSHDGRLLTSGSWDKTIRMWEVSTGREIRVLKGHRDIVGRGIVGSVAFSPDGRLLASGANDKTGLWEAQTGREVGVLKGHGGAVISVAFSPDSRLLASGSWDDTIRLWEVSTGREIRVLKGHTQTVLSVAFSLDGRLLASGSIDKTIRIWDVGRYSRKAPSRPRKVSK